MTNNEVGIRELERPGDFAAERFQDDEQKREPDEPGENSGDKREPAPQDAAPALAGVLNKPENLERDDGQNARHQIENETAQKSEEEEFCEAGEVWRRHGCRRRGAIPAERPRVAARPVRILTEDDDAVERR